MGAGLGEVMEAWWGQTSIPIRSATPPEEWGWTQEEEKPLLTTKNIKSLKTRFAR